MTGVQTLLEADLPVTLASAYGVRVAALQRLGSEHDRVERVTDESGARYVVKVSAPGDAVASRIRWQHELLRAARAAAHGQAVLSPAVASKLMGRVRAPEAEPLSQRELEVLEMVAGGSTNREAAARLFVSEATVKTHLLHIYAKLGVGDRAAAVAEAFNRGLLTPGTKRP